MWYEKEWMPFSHSSYTKKEILEEAYKAGANWQNRVLVKWLKTESDFLFKELHEGKGDLAKQYRAELYKEIIAKLKDM